MAEVGWSRKAILDTERLNEFLEAVNPDAAAKSSAAIPEGVETLELFPEAGKVVENSHGRLRDWQIPFGKRGYVVRYRYREQKVLIVSVRHQRENG
jgi:plasmid stabilization system protein ParE